MEDEFEILAAKVLAGEATREEQSRLKSLLDESAERRAEFDALRATWQSLKAAGPAAFISNPPPAKIPEARLRQLQQVVRDSLPVSHAASSESAPPSARPVPTPAPSLWQAFWFWLPSGSPLARGAAFAALVFIAIGLFVWINQLSHPVASKNSADDRPVAHLILLEGNSEVRRAGERRAVTVSVSLRSGDEISLPQGSLASLVAPNGELPLRGPVRAAVGELVASAAVTPARSTNSAAPAILFDPATELSKSNWIAFTRSVQTIVIYSPAGVTASLTPLILWKSEPGKTYDVTIQDEFSPATPPWRLTNATPPVVFSVIDAWRNRPLAVQGLYRLRVSESGRPLTASELTFRTAMADSFHFSDTPSSALQSAYRLLSGESGRVGDALALLLTLPPDLSSSELALRLKLMAFSQLNYQTDWDETAAALRRIP